VLEVSVGEWCMEICEFILKVNETKNLISIIITVIGGKNNI